MRVIIDGILFKSILDDFAKATTINNRYEKISYNDWKNLYPNDINKSIIFDFDEKNKRFYITVSLQMIYTCFSNDGKLGSFIADNWLHTIEEYNIETQKGNNNMPNNINFNFNFGPVKGDAIRLSMYGLAVQTKSGAYVSYDSKNDEIIDVDILNFKGSNFLYKMPVAIKDIKAGDIVYHNRTLVFVTGISEDKKALNVVDPAAGERKEIMLTRSPFGFNFATKIVNFMENIFNQNASIDNPFGNIWMLMAMQDNEDMGAIIPLLIMNQSNTTDPNMMMLMMMFMSNNNDSSDNSNIIPKMWLMQNMSRNATLPNTSV